MAKLAILLPSSIDLGWLWRAQALASALKGDPNAHSPVELVIGHPPLVGPFARRRLRDLRRDGAVQTREFAWMHVPVDQAQRAYLNIEVPMGVQTLAIPRDGGWNFADCDAWIVCADASVGAIVPLRPFGVYCRGLPERYVVGLYGDIHTDTAWARQLDAFLSWRRAAVTFATTPQTLEDVVAYAGVTRARTALCHPLWGLRPAAAESGRAADARGRLLWLMEPTAVHAPEEALRILDEVVHLHPGVDVLIAGEGVGPDAPGSPGAAKLLQALALRPELLSRAEMVTLRDNAHADRLAATARVVWTSALMEGEPDAPRRAALGNSAVVAPDFPQMRTTCVTDACQLYPPEDADAAVTALLAALERPDDPAAPPTLHSAADGEEVRRAAIASYASIRDSLLAPGH